MAKVTKVDKKGKQGIEVVVKKPEPLDDDVATFTTAEGDVVKHPYHGVGGSYKIVDGITVKIDETE